MKRYILKERLSYEPTGHSSSFNSARGDALGKETGDLLCGRRSYLTPAPDCKAAINLIDVCIEQFGRAHTAHHVFIPLSLIIILRSYY